MNQPTQEQLERAREGGRRDAQRGFSRYDYPWDYAEGELRRAWEDGWERFHREERGDTK